jgi:hypothetical protein
MMKWFGATALVVALMVDASASAYAASAAVQQRQASDVSPSRHQRQRYRSVERSSYSYYYGRPIYYAPAPFFPLPPFFGYGWEPW